MTIYRGIDPDEEGYDDEAFGSCCELCGAEVPFGHFYGTDMLLCKRCSGLDRCCDDLCHGRGECMHR